MQIHETAFVVSTYRSLHEDISKDLFAKLWNNPATDALIPDILKSVSKQESLLHSLRNRFFYEKLNDFFKIHPNGTLINFGAGFSMYQFQLPKNSLTIEIDKEYIVAYKKNKVDQWMNNNSLPQRNIKYLSIDFNTSPEEEIIHTIKPLLVKKPSFILLEGVLFFLNKKVTHKLFSIFNQIQQTGDLIGSVSYLPEIESTEVYQRLLHYFDSNNDTQDSFNHQTIPHSFYKNIAGYDLIESIDEFMLSKIYAPQSGIQNTTETLNENLYLLQKKIAI